MTTRKYEFVTDDTILVNDVILTRIRALIDIPGICKIGDLGGYIEKEENLSHAGKCWVADDACVCEEAKVLEGAQVIGDARVYGNAYVYRDAQVSGDARIFEDAQVCGNAEVFGNARVYGNAQVYGDARVVGDVQLSGSVCLRVDADVSERHHAVWFSNVGTENGTLTVFKTKDGVKVTRGCFTGTPEAFLAASKAKHDTETQKEYKLLIEMGLMRVTRVQ